MEKWKEIEGFDYEINAEGIVRRITTKRVKKSFKRKDGYIGIQLYKEGKIKNFQLHILIAKAFIPNLENKLFINHINSIRDDNRIENLEWVTFSENVLHSYKQGMSSNKGSKNGFSILNEQIVLDIRDSKDTVKELSKRYGVAQNTITQVLNRITWKHVN